MAEAVAKSRIYFDTNIFRDAFEGTDERASQLNSVFEAAPSSTRQVVTSGLTLAELLGTEAPGRGWAWQTRFYLGLIVDGRFVDLRPITRTILIETGEFRRRARQENRNIRLPDAIHAVTAIDAGCHHVFTADKRFPLSPLLKTIPADAAGIGSVKTLLHA